MSEAMVREPNVIVEEMRVLLVELLENGKVSNENKTSLLTSILTEVHKVTYTGKELAQTVLDFQYRRLSDFDQKIMDLMYRADEENKLRLLTSFPKLGAAYIKYGKENVNMLAIIIEEDK